MPDTDPLAPLMMAEFYKLGCNISWIAQTMHCSRARVNRQLEILIDLPLPGKAGRPKKKPVSETRKQQVRDLAEAGISALDIAQAMEIDLPTILTVISDKKVKRRPCLGCEAMTPGWICKKCKRRQAKAGSNLYDRYF